MKSNFRDYPGKSGRVGRSGIHILLVACAQFCYISVNPFTSCVTDRYQLQQYNIIETETETNMKICMYKDFIMQMYKMLLYFR